MTSQILRAKDVCALLNIAKPTFYKWVKEGRLPPGVRYGPNVVGWPREVIEKWIAEKTAAAPVSR
ncbi:AlpA family transcriptional regulator [Anaeromyxobacter sp. SG17]|uniref:helix-turn-helix transcriptional regulator n=1 Tax=Anaeromyxobacter sp. SG17 TaxID=2925405 RepID=UPI001F5644ED|nr:helix-turn-helix domain-containing protein [Anaeromyxobacter sp. SG17]